MKFTKGQSGNPAGRPKKSPAQPPPPSILSQILIDHPSDPPNRKFEMFGRPSIDSVAKLIWAAVTNGEARFVHGVMPLSFNEWFELVNWLFGELEQPPPESQLRSTSILREKLLALANEPCIGQTHFDNKNALASMIWHTVHEGMLGVRTGVIHLTPREWLALIAWVGTHTTTLKALGTPPKPPSNQNPDRSPDKTGNNREFESETSNDPRSAAPPPTAAPSQTRSNQNPDRSPDKTGNNREIESETSNDPRSAAPPPTAASSQTRFNQKPDRSPDKTGNNREFESETSNDPRSAAPPPTAAPSQTRSNQKPDPAPDKTGNSREFELGKAFRGLGKALTQNGLGLTPPRHWGEGAGEVRAISTK
jgi:hypothetical protein